MWNLSKGVVCTDADVAIFQHRDSVGAVAYTCPVADDEEAVGSIEGTSGQGCVISIVGTKDCLGERLCG